MRRVLDATKSTHKGETGSKLTWLGEYLGETKPDVLFLMEVSGSTRQSGRLRQWLRRQGYDMRFMPGDAEAEQAPPLPSPEEAASPSELLMLASGESCPSSVHGGVLSSANECPSLGPCQ